MSGKCLIILDIGAGGPGFGSQYPWWVAHSHLWLQLGAVHLWPPQELQSYAHTLCAGMQHVYIIKNKILQSKNFGVVGHLRFWIFTSRMLSSSPMRNNILAVLWFPPPPCPHTHIYTRSYTGSPCRPSGPSLHPFPAWEEKQEPEAKPLRAPW